MKRALFVALFSCIAAAQEPAPSGPAFATSFLRLPRWGTRVLARDFDGDGDLDLLFAEPGGFGLRLLRDDGTYAGEHDAFLPLPAPRVAWDVAELAGSDRASIVAIVDGKAVRAYSLGANGRFGAGELLIETRGYLPRGAERLRFVRDVDGDGRADLIVPAGGRYRIHLAREEGGYAKPLEVVYEASIDYAVGDPERLDARFGQSLRIPWFRIEDVDGDGRADLVSQTEDALRVHLASPELAPEPSWTLDLEALRNERPPRDGVDLDDLLANIDLDVDWRIADLDGHYPNDLVVQIGSVVKVYLDATRSGPAGEASQVLKLSGNLLHAFVRDVGGSPLPDLQLLRGEKIALSTVIRWLVFPGSIDFALFTYENEGGRFSRRPTRQNTVTIEIPRLLSFLGEMHDLEDVIDAQQSIPARRFAADADGREDDVADVVDGALAIYRNHPVERGTGETFEDFDGDFDALIEELVLRDLDAQGGGATKSFDLSELSSWHFSEGAALRAALGDARPDERVPLVWSQGALAIRVADLDADGRPDFVLVGQELGPQGQFTVLQTLVRRGR